jgi:hypothetical protein
MLVETSLFQNFGDGVRRTDTHDSGRDTHDCRRNVFANDGEAQAPSC